MHCSNNTTIEEMVRNFKLHLIAFIYFVMGEVGNMCHGTQVEGGQRTEVGIASLLPPCM